MWRVIGTGVGVLLLTALMPEIFYAYIDPNEEYQITVNSMPFDERLAGGIAAVAMLLVSLWSLDLAKDRACFWISACLFTTLVVPAVVIGPLVYRESPWPIIEVNMVLVGCFAGFVALGGIVETRLGNLWHSIVGGGAGERQEPASANGDHHILDWALLTAMIVGMFVVVVILGFNVNLREGLEDVYVVRLFLRDAQLGFVGYVANWVIVLTPSILFGMFAGGPSRTALALVLTLIVETTMLMATSTKVGIWHAILPIAFFLLRPYEHRTRVFAIVFGLVVVGVVLPVIGGVFPDLATICQGVPRRVFYATGFLHGFGIELFSELPPFGFQDFISYFTGEAVETRYTFILGSFVGSGYDSNANVSFLVDGYINGRYIGMVAVTIAAAVSVGILAGLSNASRSTIGILFSIALGQLYAETAFQQVYLTGGLGIMMIYLTARGILLGRRSESNLPLQPGKITFP